MCLIVDANVAGKFLAQSSAVVDWLFGIRGNPRLVAAGTLLKELAVDADVRRRLVRLEQAGRLRSPDAEKLLLEEQRLRAAGQCTSNDHHVLALAVLSGARTLATDDGALAVDFRNKAIIDKPRGSIYSHPDKHAHLLRHTPSCGVKARRV